ncbi:MAG: CsbD family protein [Deltaproteobacteria bacterium]|nr:CsbD family protein [Deltaproteobacteria bacterium]
MNKNTVQGNWSEVKGKIKATWSKFSDDEIEAFKGNLELLSGKIQKTYGYAQERAEREYQAFKAALTEPAKHATPSPKPVIKAV